jgi:hypothetical protein
MRSGYYWQIHLKSLTLRGSVQLTRQLPNLFMCHASYQACAQTYTDEAIFAAICCKNTVVSPLYATR